MRSLTEIYDEVLRGRQIDHAVRQFLQYLEDVGVKFKDGVDHRDWFSAKGLVRWPTEPEVTAVIGQNEYELSLDIIVTPHPFQAEVRQTTIHGDGWLGESQIVLESRKLTVLRYLSQPDVFGPPARTYGRKHNGLTESSLILVDFERWEGAFRCVLSLPIPIPTDARTQSEIFGVCN